MILSIKMMGAPSARLEAIAWFHIGAMFLGTFVGIDVAVPSVFQYWRQ